MIDSRGGLVNRGTSHYPAPMEPLTMDALRALARAQALDCSDEELAGLLPLVEGGRQLIAGLDEALRPEVEPTSEFRLS